MPMTFDILKVATDYINPRYNRATDYEKQKYINDWVRKVETARKTIPDIEKRAGTLSGKKILDVGSGNGGNVIAFTEVGADAYGIEVEQELFDISLEHIKSFNLEPKIKLYDGFVLPYDDNFFDLAFSASVLEHTDDPKMYLAQVLRVLKQGGKFYLAFPNKLWPKETHTGLWFLTYFPGLLRPLVIKIFHKNPLEDNNLHFYSYSNLMKMIKEINQENKLANKIGVWEVVHEEGETKSGKKKIIKNILAFFGLTYKMFMPHVSVILVKR